MKTLFCIGLLSAVLPLALPAAVEDFKSYADTEALRKSWTGFGGGNPAPSASLSTLDGAPAMELSTSGEPGDKVIVRELAVQPGERLTFTMHSDMKNAPGAYAYVALRSDRNAGNLVLHDFRLVPGQPVRVEIPNEGRFNWQDQVAMLICLHDAGAPMRVTVGAIDLPGAAPAREFHDTPEARRERREKLLHGRTVQIDTAFPYYHNRSNESIASELRVNGFDGVYYYTGTDTGLRPGLVGEMQRQKLGVGLMTLPSLVYWSEAQLAERLPAGWRDWLIEFTGSGMDIYRFIGFVYPEYNAWYKNYLNGMLLRHRFDAFTFAEIMYPIYETDRRRIRRSTATSAPVSRRRSNGRPAAKRSRTSPIRPIRIISGPTPDSTGSWSNTGSEPSTTSTTTSSTAPAGRAKRRRGFFSRPGRSGSTFRTAWRSCANGRATTSSR